MNKIKFNGSRVHIIGIGGIHMSAIARLLKERGLTITGSDLEETALTKDLKSEGITIFSQHDASNVSTADLVITTAAVKKNHIEIVEAEKRKIPILRRSEAIAELIDGKKIIAISGSHGKTSTSTLIATILKQSNFSPMYVLGGESQDLTKNSAWGSGIHCVVEADEYKRAFLDYEPDLEVITNIDADHLDDYGSRENYYNAFLQFAKNLKSSGLILLCGDDKGTGQLLSEITDTGLRYESYGFEETNTWVARDLNLNHSGARFELSGPSNFEHGLLEISVPGKHAVLNALAAAAVSLHEGVQFSSIQKTLKQFHGVKRRFELIGETRGISVIDDYAHHPTEVQATLETTRMRYTNHRLIAIYQPHTYSRTAYLWENWLNCWKGLDKLIILETYAARELPNQGKTANELADSITSTPTIYAATEQEAIEHAIQETNENTVILTIGAGNITNIAPKILEAIA